MVSKKRVKSLNEATGNQNYMEEAFLNSRHKICRQTPLPKDATTAKNLYRLNGRRQIFERFIEGYHANKPD